MKHPYADAPPFGLDGSLYENVWCQRKKDMPDLVCPVGDTASVASQIQIARDGGWDDYAQGQQDRCYGWKDEWSTRYAYDGWWRRRMNCPALGWDCGSADASAPAQSKTDNPGPAATNGQDRINACDGKCPTREELAAATAGFMNGTIDYADAANEGENYDCVRGSFTAAPDRVAQVLGTPGTEGAMQIAMEECVAAYSADEETKLVQATTTCWDPSSVKDCHRCTLKLRKDCEGSTNADCFKEAVCSRPEICKTGVCEGYDGETRLTESTRPDDLLGLIEQETQGSARSKVSAGWSCG